MRFENDEQKKSSQKKQYISLHERLLFFPICGFTLGRTTVKEVLQHHELYPDVIEIKTRINNDDSVMVKLQNGAVFWAFNNSQFFNRINFWRDDKPMFDKWKKIGFDWDLSYEQWYQLFKAWGYKISILREPDVVMNQLNEQYLLAEFEAVSPSQQFKFDLGFAYGKDGSQPYSPRSLYCLSCSCIDV